MNITQSQERSEEEINVLTGKIIRAAIDVHRELGPGFLEIVYEKCLVYELRAQQLKVESQKPLPIKYKNLMLDCEHRLDVLVEDQVIVEVKAVALLAPIHEAQLLSYLKVYGGNVTGLLINFNVKFLRDGIRRMK